MQVDLNTFQKISQYDDIDSSASGYGKNACGFVAAAAAVGGANWVELVDEIADAAGDAYANESGIQPTAYVRALEQVLGADNITELNESSLDEIYFELVNNNIVIVDVKVNSAKLVPSATTPNYAHFARVLGMDMSREEIYIENTLRGAAYWTVSFDDFTAAWTHPETTASLIPDPPNAEDVTFWAVVLDGSLLSRVEAVISKGEIY